MRVAVCTLFVALLAAAASAGAGESASTERLRSYCSPSGDVCYGIFRRQGAVFLEISTFARYFSRYRLCVDGPRRGEVCRSFPIRRRGTVFGSAVRWNANFPRERAGVYRVTWKLQSRLGPTLSFRLR